MISPEDSLNQSPMDAANHLDNLRRFATLEIKIDENSRVTTKAASDVSKVVDDMETLKKSTADLLELWGDAGVFFKWLRRLGAATVTIAAWLGGAYAIYYAWTHGGPPK